LKKLIVKVAAAKKRQTQKNTSLFLVAYKIETIDWLRLLQAKKI